MNNLQEVYPEAVICIVDNNDSNLKLLSSLLEDNNYEFIVANSREKFLNTLQNISVDLILINLSLEKEQWQICQSLQSAESKKNIPIIFLGNTQNEINQIKKLNIENFDNIKIPIQADEFLTKIKLHLQIFSLKKQLQSQNQILQEEILLRENIENEVRKHKSTLENLIENLPGMVYQSNHDCHLVMNLVSDSCYSLTGYQSKDFIQNQIFYNQLIHLEDRKLICRQRQKALVTHQPFQLVYRIITANQELKWVWEQGKGIYCCDGKISAIKGLIIDITAQKQVEAELTKQNLALQKTETALIIVNQKLQKLAKLDGLTGIANRRDFDEYLEKEWLRLSTTKSP
ncbi:PAS domain-containing protein [Okeania sp. SIO1I7]|uniref:PAS domain-containing protein n=1 Tax=Okeania sp. SIO1I7 TaxID=2607772 RepID=UPI0013FC9FC9|nr:PAS domain-containing protein [Okeania sp. SIO1I7]NET24306.1 PAS domain-containing protein [Okeania sp. SIO1I7]